MGSKWSNFETFTMMAGIKRGYTQREIADLLKRTPKAVERRVWRVKQTVVRTPLAMILERMSF